MSEAKKKTGKATAAQKAAAARAEATDEPKVITWRGLTFEGPPMLPGTIAFDLAAAEASGTPGGIYSILLSVLGDEQMQQVRVQLAADDVSLQDAFGVLFDELVRAVVEPYGAGPGES